ncbi:MAG: 50S ribosomal protein L32 [Candidatus Nealsonbacteria bacterium RIFCSPHIGHO2_01_FULL_43_31]|uniref:Large ribosomal subunit protein bL32 n=2 Tax=Candidatus Nealsoniibacteriota TaxID=1817911 RepID=A0A1G2E798_9BACT|nr:MAG: 50S ribosomal protein L32 [Candidatus Nealsonbacteria bacterium RIFCSPHIGHO2_01_FULL_43_31]OGZ21744.1 MAG: 50S ribosomal protein L32 [Candidatus Nealsonbacteria bacterium RIFCSPHIGHO2_02_FULL_43_13]
MALPKWRHTKSRRNKRRMHLFIKEPALVVCPKCAKPVLPHIACRACGYYKGEEVIDVLKKLTKKERKQKEKEIAAKEAASKRGEPRPEKSGRDQEKKA